MAWHVPLQDPDHAGRRAVNAGLSPPSLCPHLYRGIVHSRFADGPGWAVDKSGVPPPAKALGRHARNGDLHHSTPPDEARNCRRRARDRRLHSGVGRNFHHCTSLPLVAPPEGAVSADLPQSSGHRCRSTAEVHGQASELPRLSPKYRYRIAIDGPRCRELPRFTAGRRR